MKISKRSFSSRTRDHSILPTGFTLIELFVVIANVALLTSMPLLTLAKAKPKAQGLRWLSNHRQLLHASQMYAEASTTRILEATSPNTLYSVEFDARPPLPYAESELLVKFEGGPSGYGAVEAHAIFGAEVIRNFDEIGWQHIRLPDGVTVENGLDWYQKRRAFSPFNPITFATRAQRQTIQSSPINGHSRELAPLPPGTSLRAVPMLSSR